MPCIGSEQQPHYLQDKWTVQHWSVIFKLWLMFTKHQGPSSLKQFPFKASFTALLTKQSKQLDCVLRYIQLHTSLCPCSQRSCLAQCLGSASAARAAQGIWDVLFWVWHSTRLAAGGPILPATQASGAVLVPAKGRGRGWGTWREFVLQVVQWTPDSCSWGQLCQSKEQVQNHHTAETWQRQSALGLKKDHKQEEWGRTQRKSNCTVHCKAGLCPHVSFSTSGLCHQRKVSGAPGWRELQSLAHRSHSGCTALLRMAFSHFMIWNTLM